MQVLIAAFFLLAAAGPKLLGEQYAVQTFTEIGAGQWFRYLIGALELAGAVGLLVPRLAGPAAVGLASLMVGAVLTQVFVLDAAVMAPHRRSCSCCSGWSPGAAGLGPGPTSRADPLTTHQK